MIVIDGNDGTGKSTLVERLRGWGFRVSDRGLPTKLTVEEPNLPPANPGDKYLILEAPIEVSRARLEAAEKDLNEKWHTEESLRHFAARFREVGAKLGATFIDSSGTSDETWIRVLTALGIENRMPRVGLPKGRLQVESVHYINTLDSFAGKHDRGSGRLLTFKGDLGEYRLLKAKSIPDMIALGFLDLGITGEDLIKESVYEDQIGYRILDDHPINISVLAPKGWQGTKLPSRPVTIATEYPNLASRWAAKSGLAHIIVRTYGSTEAYVPAFCDIAIDVVETGETAAANGLEVIEVITESRPVVAFRHHSGMSHHKLVPK